MELITPAEEERLHEKLISYYERVYPDVKFQKQKITLGLNEIGEVFYTYPGEESEATFTEKTEEILKVCDRGYCTPVILIKKKDSYILVDGHRRLKVAWDLKLEWPALLIIPEKEIKLGIEKIITGKIKDIWKK
ncbi:hypothetical protein HY570_02850 [Candidatus Micrarchaeota archaeon]|nr:hypothetical protein [Candidatus Micrarchaeota archaeon]